MRPKSSKSMKENLTDQMERAVALRGEKTGRERFFVEEYIPAHTEYNHEWGETDLVSEQILVQKKFDTFDEANKFLNVMEPDDGAELRIVKEEEYKKEVFSWHSA